ncbi:MAG: phosphatase PAP2 family protein [Opitutaceae bacterium]|nr:phosphatase PAP2 family protein [Cytophagales bacterium]
MSFWSKLVEADQNLFFILNSMHFSWLDQLMFLFSSDWFWIPLYGLFLFLLIKRYQKKSWLPILFIIGGVILSDQISGVIKKTVQRPRPTHDLTLREEIHTVNGYKGGSYGFVSSHAANTFCIATMLISFLYFRNFAFVLSIMWAILVSYSRIYLGVHFPADILGGAILGLIVAISLIIIKKRVEKQLIYKG